MKRVVGFSNTGLVKCLFSFAFVVGLAFTVKMPVFASAIKDISSCSDYAQESILTLAGNNVISGDENSNFKPKDIATRAQMVAIIVSSLGLDTSKAPETPTFRDVPKTHWAYKYVETAFREGLVKGVAPDIFGIDKMCTREQMAKLFVNSMNMTPEEIEQRGGGKEVLLKFSDRNKISEWAQNEIAYAVHEKIMEGTSPITFDPDKYATREQMAVMTDRFIKMKERVLDELEAAQNVQITAQESSIDFYFNKPVRGVAVDQITDSNGNNIDIHNLYFYNEVGYSQSIKKYPIFGECYTVQAVDYHYMNLKKGETYLVKFHFLLDDDNAKVMYVEQNVTVMDNAYKVLAVLPRNGSQILVKFGGEPDMESALDISHYSITDGDGRDIAIKGVEFAQNNSSYVVLNLAKPVVGPKNISVSVHEVISKHSIYGTQSGNTDGTFRPYTAKMLINDHTPPKVVHLDVGSEGSTINSVKIDFSEPVSSGMIFLDNRFVGTASGETTILPDLNLDSSKNHKLYILYLTDGVNITQSQFFSKMYYSNIGSDVEYTTRLVITDVSYTRDSSGRVDNIVINFNKPLAFCPGWPGGGIVALDENYNQVSAKDTYIIDGVTGEPMIVDESEVPSIFCYTSKIVNKGDTQIVFPVVRGLDIYDGKYTLILPGNLALAQDEALDTNLPTVWDIEF